MISDGWNLHLQRVVNIFQRFLVKLTELAFDWTLKFFSCYRGTVIPISHPLWSWWWSHHDKLPFQCIWGTSSSLNNKYVSLYLFALNSEWIRKRRVTSHLILFSAHWCFSSVLCNSTPSDSGLLVPVVVSSPTWSCFLDGLLLGCLYFRTL